MVANNGQDSSSIVLDLAIYSLEAIKKTCYQFSSELAATINKLDDGKVKVDFLFDDSVNDQMRQELVRQFHNYLLDQDLREIVFKETEEVRNLILAHAFSKTSLIEPE